MIPFLQFLKRWSIEIIVAIVLLLLGYLWLSARVEANLNATRMHAAEQARDEALQKAAKGEEAAQRAAQLQATVDLLDGERRDLLAKVDTLNAELKKRPMPPAPGPAPTEQAQVIADLRTMGTSPEPLPPLKLAFPASDGPVLWTWGKQAARVPALEGRIGALENFSTGVQLTLGKTTDQLKATESQRNEFKASTAHFEGAYKAEAKRGDLLKLQVGEVTAQRDRARRTRVYIGVGAFAAGVYLGSRR